MKANIFDARKVVERYDADQDKKLGFWEFSNMFLSVDPLLRDDLEGRKAVWDMGFETKEQVRRLLKKVIELEDTVEGIRQRIAREASVSLKKAFEAIDV